MPIGELARVLAVMATATDQREAIVLHVDVRHDGSIVVKIGFQAAARAGSGKYILLRQTEFGWGIAEVCRWRS
jgi:hypothetical protein